MAITSFAQSIISINPLDKLENFFEENRWSFSRTKSSELVAQTCSGWTEYILSFSWDHNAQALYFVCIIPLPFHEQQLEKIHCLASMVNCSVGMGHFEVEADACCLAYRHTLPTRGLEDVPLTILQDIIDVALGECERFFPAVDLLINHNYDTSTALAASLHSTQQVGYA